ncbi:PTS galactitol transporter subunit IIA [Pullulanibacillus camelliae]|uniref:PTS galactitol transporter subunit IIA n=1 Tax=Pullulanibacillus camelliae TaxID=1707096 RepID=A0A8J2YB49_9BACL|nr:PTS sugar transporter subunit IIA [Pullulanibacillus camelliae]GGE31550.1 PTS galactitol transporter subunit IIA [Pullulanibacillus camelliae]
MTIDHSKSQLILNEELIRLSIQAHHSEEVLIQLSENFRRKNYVKASFTDALIARELEYPTGLLTQSVGIAIPHTDPKHVNKGSIGIGVLEHPVLFKTMDTREEINVSIVIMLAITHPSDQLKMLQKVTAIIKDNHVLLDMMHAQSAEEVMRLLQPFFGEMIE